MSLTTSKPTRVGSQEGVDDNSEKEVVEEERAEVGVEVGQGVVDPRRDARGGGCAEVEAAVAWSSLEGAEA